MIIWSSGLLLSRERKRREAFHDGFLAGPLALEDAEMSLGRLMGLCVPKASSALIS